jgi:hypothetical protein
MTEQECFNALVTGLLTTGTHPHEVLGYPPCGLAWRVLGRPLPGCEGVIGDVEYIYDHVKPAKWNAALLKIAQKRSLIFPKIGVS